jgi:hypothetical protein
MGELSPEAAAFVRAGRTTFNPDASDRERVLQSLTRTLGEDALFEGAPSAKLAKSAAKARFPVWGKVIGGLGALGVGVALIAPHLWSRTPTSGAAPVTSSIPPAAQLEPLPITPSESEPTPGPPATQSVPEAPRPNARSALPRSPSDSLAEEVRLVSKAEQQLSAGRADDALKTLGEHERRFPNGALTELRMAARVQSLCTLGRTAEARADLTKLARAYPQSPQLDRTRRFCAIDTP